MYALAGTTGFPDCTSQGSPQGLQVTQGVCKVWQAGEMTDYHLRTQCIQVGECPPVRVQYRGVVGHPLAHGHGVQPGEPAASANVLPAVHGFCWLASGCAAPSCLEGGQPCYKDNETRWQFAAEGRKAAAFLLLYDESLLYL